MTLRFLPWLLAATAVAAAQELPVVTVSRSGAVLTGSCVLAIPEGVVLPADGGNGAIRVRGDGITIRFRPGSILRGAAAQTPGERLTGIGIRAEGCKDLVIEGAAIQGFRVGIEAIGCDGVEIRNARLGPLFRQRLASTREGEAASDWLSPHANDGGEWVRRYGAAIHIQNARGARVRNTIVRDSQNGIVLDRVQESEIFDNDCSFLSGWGIALWRSDGNLISRNALDFCVRGYSHGVYNRGQDSAGLLLFEQCNRNVAIENSITHGGDGIFGFAGREALAGKAPAGCNDNLFAFNDLSFAAAHGLEMTFSFGNRISQNLFEGNAICGVWGGYSRNTLIDNNDFIRNGDMAYGLERGGVNIEHGSGNRILANRFVENRCGVHLWDDEDANLMKMPWVVANHLGCTGESILANLFRGDRVGIHLRAARKVRMDANRFEDAGEPVKSENGSSTAPPAGEIPPAPPLPRLAPRGESRPVGARPRLRGRQHIVMTPYGPWDHESPLLVDAGIRGRSRDYLAHGLQGEIRLAPGDAGPAVSIELIPPAGDGAPRIRVASLRPGLHDFGFTVAAGNRSLSACGFLLHASWEVRLFPWTRDPREDYEAWRRESRGPRARVAVLEDLRLPFAHGGAAELAPSPAVAASDLPKDRFGTIATASIPLQKGRYRVKTLSDDGVRVRVNGAVVVENWTWHAPVEDTGEFALPEDGEACFEVEHFELDGYAILAFDLLRVAP